MKSYKEEIKQIQHQIHLNYAKTQLNTSSCEGSPTSIYLTKAAHSNLQNNLNLTETTAMHDANSSRTQPNYPNGGEITWRELSFNVPSRIIKVPDFIPFNKNSIQNKKRPSSSSTSTPYLKKNQTSQKDKSISQYLKGDNKNNSITKSFILKKQDYANSSFKAKTEGDRQLKKKGQQQMQDAALYDFLQDHLSDLYQDQALDPYKPNMNLEKRSYAISQQSIKSSTSIQALEQQIKQKNLSEQQRIEVEYQLEKKKAHLDNKLYFKKLYKIQKSALNNYLNGEGVEENVIDCHKEIINPLTSYVKQKQLENIQKHQQELNRSFIKNNQKPIYQSQFKQRQEQQLKVQMFKGSNNKKTDSNQGVSSLDQIQKKKEQMQKEAQANFLDNFLKGERVYFEKLGEIQNQAKQSFIQEIHVNQKYYFDQQLQPEEQFLSKNDIKTEKNVSIIKALQKKQQINQMQQLNAQRNSLQTSKSRDTLQSILLNKLGSNIIKRAPTRLLMPQQKSNILSQQVTIDESQNFIRQASRRQNQNEQNDSNLENETFSIHNQIQQNQDLKEDSSQKNKKSQQITNLLEVYQQKQDDFIKYEKNQIIQKEKAVQSINNMNNTIQELSSKLEGIQQIQQLTEFEQEIFSYVKNNKIKEFEACIHANEQIIHLQDSTGKTLLHWAAMRGQEEIVNILLKNKSQLSATDLNKKMPKDLALQYNQQKIYGILQKEERYQRQLQTPKMNAAIPAHNSDLISQLNIEIQAL
ncbi:hypothetical protein ABPG74_015237 [Tetrahymena malaccensis]